MKDVMGYEKVISIVIRYYFFEKQWSGELLS